MEDLIARWLKETLREYEQAKTHQNTFKMLQMWKLEKALRIMRDNLLK